MPRPNPGRSLKSEESLARRIEFERKRRKWTHDGLADRMKRVGCPIRGSAIYKIENGNRRAPDGTPLRRGISVDELVALAKVFETSLDDLLLPPEVVETSQAVELFLAWDKAAAALTQATTHHDEAWEAMETYVHDHPELFGVFRAAFDFWGNHHFASQHPAAPAAAAAFWSAMLAPDPLTKEELMAPWGGVGALADGELPRPVSDAAMRRAKRMGERNG